MLVIQQGQLTARSGEVSDRLSAQLKREWHVEWPGLLNCGIDTCSFLSNLKAEHPGPGA